MAGKSDTALLKLYRLTTDMLGPLLPLWVNARAKKGKEEAARLSERRGRSSAPRPDGPLIWMHGASVGECTMLLPLIAQIREARPDVNVLITSGTVTAARLMAERLPSGVIHQYVPLDRRKYARAFLDYWRPDVAIWAESEIWPNLIIEAKSRGVNLALINARMSEKSLGGWRKRAGSARAIFSRFDLILAADKATAAGLSEFVGKAITPIGNLKDAALPLPVDAKAKAALLAAMGARPVWCAASTHHGEDDIVLGAHETVLNTSADALLILAPRHPERRENIAELINSMGLSFTTRSSGAMPDANTQIYLFDTIGEMGLAFDMSRLSLICGSLTQGLSGHNPLEPARAGCAVMSGRHVASFAEVYQDMADKDAVKIISQTYDLGRSISTLLNDKAALKDAQTKAKAFCDSRADVLAQVWAALSPLLPERETR